jgi:hypothetical protein
MKEFTTELSILKQRLLQANEKKQLLEIKPVEKTTKANKEVQLMIWIDADLMKKIKFRTIEEETSIKEIVSKAVTKYLS